MPNDQNLPSVAEPPSTESSDSSKDAESEVKDVGKAANNPQMNVIVKQEEEDELLCGT